jgi:TolA-binding protein
MRRAVPPFCRIALLAALLSAVAPPAGAQVESREAIALQNQILQLRQELDLLRRGGAVAPPAAPAGRPGAPAGGELVGTLLTRVAALEEEVRRLRGRLEEVEFARRQLSQALEKLQGDIDFRLQQLEGQGGRAPAGVPAPPPALGPRVAPPAGASPPLPPIAAPPGGSSAAPPPRPPERAIAEGQAALARRDYAAAEAAAREALRSRGLGPRAMDAQMLLADSLAGKRDFGGSALAYNEAYGRNRAGPRAPEALIGLANSFVALGSRREACDTLAELRASHPGLRPPLSERAQDARQRAGCR